MRFAHAHGVRVHVTVNTMPRNDEVARLPDYLATLEAYGVDALIVADVGVLCIGQAVCASCTEAPHQHAGQCCQLPGGACLARSGADRVILARELTLEEIAEIRAKTPPSLQLETFVHGAMCVSIPAVAC